MLLPAQVRLEFGKRQGVPQALEELALVEEVPLLLVAVILTAPETAPEVAGAPQVVAKFRPAQWEKLGAREEVSPLLGPAVLTGPKQEETLRQVPEEATFLATALMLENQAVVTIPLV